MLGRCSVRVVAPVVLRNETQIGDPLSVVLGFLETWRLDLGEPSRPTSFTEADLRLANRGGARISAGEIDVVLRRRRAIERALRAIPPGTSLAGRGQPWLAIRQLFEPFAGIRGLGLAKMTKALHPKRPALIPMLDSVVQRYLADDDAGRDASFAERALAFVRGYKRDLDANRDAVQAVRRQVAAHGYTITDVRILDLLIWSVAAPPRREARE
jgi:hypothetical protein